MDGRDFRRERLLASGLLREVSQEEAVLLSKGMEAYMAQGKIAVPGNQPRPMAVQAPRPPMPRASRPRLRAGSPG